MSALKKTALASSFVVGGVLTMMEFGVVLFGQEGENVQGLIHRKILEQVNPSGVSLSFDPAKVTYSIDDDILLSVFLLDDKGQRLPDKRINDFNVHFTADRPTVSIEADRLLVKGTGRVLVRACITEKVKKDSAWELCGDSEIMAIDNALPF